MFHISHSDIENFSSPNSAGPVYLTIKLYFGFYQLHELTKNNASHIVDQTLIQFKKRVERKGWKKGRHSERERERETWSVTHTGESEREIKGSQIDGQLVRHKEGRSTDLQRLLFILLFSYLLAMTVLNYSMGY